MNKPRVLIAMHYLHLGGAETALIGLLHAWDYERADVDLFLYARRGELLPELPPEVNLLPELADYRAIESPVAEALRSGRLVWSTGVCAPDSIIAGAAIATPSSTWWDDTSHSFCPR